MPSPLTHIIHAKLPDMNAKPETLLALADKLQGFTKDIFVKPVMVKRNPHTRQG